jgi:site-specific DNA-methyltransferase (adenine-specific)
VSSSDLDAVKLAMKKNGVSRAQLQEALGNFMLAHYLTAASQPAIPNWRDYQIIRDCVGLGDKYDELFIPEAEREVIGSKKTGDPVAWYAQATRGLGIVDITAPATPAAEQWQGWGTALKPAHEPIVVARKPLIGTVAENVLTHGTGALNIDGCRIGTEVRVNPPGSTSLRIAMNDGWRSDAEPTTATGRWPANVILDESQAAELDKQSGDRPTSKPGQVIRRRDPVEYDSQSIGAESRPAGSVMVAYGDTGGASRFFYVAKAGKKERPNVDGVAHPTVKPMALMRYLVRLVTPPGGTVLEPFAGSGTTIEAALEEGFNVIGIEMTDEYLPLIMARIERYGDKLC